MNTNIIFTKTECKFIIIKNTFQLEGQGKENVESLQFFLTLNFTEIGTYINCIWKYGDKL